MTRRSLLAGLHVGWLSFLVFRDRKEPARLGQSRASGGSNHGAVAASSVKALENLVANGSFEEWINGRPAGWSAGPAEGVQHRLSADYGVTGGRSARLECLSYTRLSPRSSTSFVQTGLTRIRKGQWHRFSVWARAEAISGGRLTAYLVADASAPVPYETALLYMQLPVDYEWRRFEKYFRAEHDATQDSRLSFSFAETGSVWLDDVEIVKVPPVEPVFSNCVPALGSKNLLPNAGFECGTDHWSSLGKRTGWGTGLSSLYGDVVPGGALESQHCLRIELGPGKTPVTSFNVWQVTEVVQHAPLAANNGWIAVTKGREYTLSAYMRADKPGIPARLMVRFGAPLEGHVDRFQALNLTAEWKRYSFTLPAEKDYAFVAVGPDVAELPDHRATVWIDAVQLEEGGVASSFEFREALEIGLDTGRRGNIFHAGDPIKVNIRAANRSYWPAAVRLQAVIKDFFDEQVAVAARKVRIPARGTAAFAWPLGIKENGFYRVDVTWETGGRQHRRSLRLAVIDAYGPADSVFGVNHAPPTQESREWLRQAGVVWARDWSLKWQHIEPEPGRFHFEAADRHLNRVLKAGMRPMCLLPPFPASDWNTTAPERAEEKWPRYPRIWTKMAYAPKDLSAYARFVERVVQHYKGQINTWEYLNEPLYTIHSLPSVDQMGDAVPGLPGANYTVQDYVRLLRVTFEAIKKTDPTQVLIGGIGGGPNLLTCEFFEAGGLLCLDVLNLHIYPGVTRPEAYIPQMGEMLRRMEASGSGRKPVWITEYAYYGADELPWRPFAIGPGPWSPNRLLRDERQCADYSVRFAAIMLAHGVEKIFYHYGGSVDSEVNDDVDSLESWMGVHAGRPRKLYPAQAALAKILGPQPKYAARLEKPPAVNGHGTDGVYGYAFQCGDRAVLIAWAPEIEPSGPTWALGVGPGVKPLNLVGAPITDGEIRLGDSPVYLTSTPISAQELAKTCILRILE